MGCVRPWFLAGMLALSLPRFAFAETLTLNPARSAAEFSVSNFGIHHVHGRFKTLAGKIEYDANAPTQSKVLVSIQADSVDTGNTKRDHHLRSSDFFDTARFPQISYVSQSIRPVGDHYLMSGALIIKNVIKPVPVTFTYEATRQANGKTRLSAHGQASIQREDFNITYGNGLSVGHTVHIDLTVEAESASDDCRR